MEKEKVLRNNKNQNIQVFVRLRPLNARERAIRSLGVVEVVNNREVVVRQSQQTMHTKKFTFDRAFGPNAPQVEVYKEVVSPLIAEVLAGYNCTVFAYGQTGTGKTHTMVGESTNEGCTWQNDPLAGIIPRALSQLFDELRISNTEYTVRVSYLELYNEELFDLLSTSDDNSKLRIYEDVTRKGSTIVNGLEEITVYNKNEVYEIMAQGQERKKVASTLMNAQSSRSHTVFTIVVHMKENCPKGEELVKIGKLNLVDLAGSENISKAGSDNPAKKERARECVNINQSLLTLGRVITALVEKHPHIPYRESKLTRILQESLGGRTKTSIIATISPGHKDLEETMSTLEYAHRAKNIQNKPEVNQKLTKQAILKEFAEEIDKLKRELTATREKNGVYLPPETYVEMTIKHDEQRREISELLLKKRAMEEERARMEAIFSELESKCAATEEQLLATKEQLEDTYNKLSQREQECLEQQHLVERHVQTERHLASQAQQLVKVADNATADLGSLHDTVDRRKCVELTNKEVVEQYRSESGAIRSALVEEVNTATEQFRGIKDGMQTRVDDHARDASMTAETNIEDVKLLVAKMDMFVNEIKSLAETSTDQISVTTKECRTKVEGLCAERREELRAVLGQLVSTMAACEQRAAAVELAGTVYRCTEQWKRDASARVQCLLLTQSAHCTSARALDSRRDETARQHHATRMAREKEREQQIQQCIEELQKDKEAIEERITRQLALIEEDKTETERRLQRWMEEERRALEEQRRALEERLAKHAEVEREALNGRIEKYKSELAVHKQMLEEATERCVQAQRLQLEASQQETEMEDEYMRQCKIETEVTIESINKFDKEFDEDVHAIKAEMDAFGQSVTSVVEHTEQQFLGTLKQAHQTMEQEVSTALIKEEDSSHKCVMATDSALAAVRDHATHVVDTVVGKLVETTNETKSSISEMSERSCQIARSTLEHQSVQSEALAAAGGCVQRLGAAVRSAAANQADTEGRYLMKEYRLYSPTGSTPARREFRYPRRLAATSPHERILSRFRRQRQEERAVNSPLPNGINGIKRERDSPDNDYVVVVESDDGGRPSSDSEVSESSAVSEDSAVAMQ